MTTNTPQLDSEELRAQLISTLGLVETLNEQLVPENVDDFLSDWTSTVGELAAIVQADRAAFADRVLAVVPEKTDEYADNLSDTTKSFIMGQNQAIDQVTTAITNLVAAPTRGDKGETE